MPLDRVLFTILTSFVIACFIMQKLSWPRWFFGFAICTIMVLWICLFLNKSTMASLPIVISTWGHIEPFKKANMRAYDELKKGGSALDAVEIGCSVCEELQCDGTVGFGGSPDENSETTLDAMILDGRTMNAGSVAALRNIRNAVKVARYVLEYTKHTLLAGSQATEFAISMGLHNESLTTDKSRAEWEEWKKNKCQPNFWTNVEPNPKEWCGPYHITDKKLKDASSETNENKKEVNIHSHDTIGMVAIDLNENIAVATSTNGANHKIPGRVGDSPIIGSGGYAENGVGGAAATGDGDILMRFLPSFKAVEALKRGMTSEEAARSAINSIRKYYGDFSGAIVVVSASGEYAAACHGFDEFTYCIADGENDTKVIKVSCTKDRLYESFLKRFTEPGMGY